MLIVKIHNKSATSVTEVKIRISHEINLKLYISNSFDEIPIIKVLILVPLSLFGA